MLGFFSRKKRLNDSAHKLFSAVIDQSRKTVFYEYLKVEDSLDGRFDLMTAHMSIIINILDQNERMGDAKSLKRIIQEIMFDNLDLTLREIGVGDLGVGKKVKVMAEAFYGRVAVYQKSFKNKDEESMKAALKRNLYRERDIDEKTLSIATRYVFSQNEHIKSQEIENIIAGEINFLVPESK